jgi:hypothetical protein
MYDVRDFGLKLAPVAGCTVRSPFSGVLANLLKATASFMSVRPSVCLSGRPAGGMEQLGSHWTAFDEVWCLRLFRKYVENIQVSLK